MDITTIDQSYAQLETQAGQTRTAMNALNQKLQAAASSGDNNAREWSLDLREVALQMQQEQAQVGQLLQALHDFVVANAHQPLAQASEPSYAQQAPAQGGMLSRLMGGGFGQSMGRGGGGGFGQALITGAGMGVGMGAGEAIIGDLFG